MNGPGGLDPERELALLHVPAERRAGVAALWGLDAAFGSVLSTGRDRMISRIRLAWWREALERLDTAAPPAEPVLGALAGSVLPAGIRGADLALMEEGWARLLEDHLETVDLETFARLRGGRLFDLTASLLGAGPRHPDLEKAGKAWSLVDLARRSSRVDDIAAALRVADGHRVEGRWPRRLRPLGMLYMLAKRDIERGPEMEGRGAPARLVRMLRHRLTGT